ncbi:MULTISPECIES: DUF5802 family protein [unclassified Haloferax]|uniref:DUF5802 family protein n=1 Tax=unclassified Haloferax TaxID=2625095 RepID=UPI0028761B9E|nr:MULTISPECIES: DUF5802 family protein [unclassified Haloferax]MDS0241054.1 DUF5802 family protein [Haloferax sp. S2CR25]MDS0444175.1 DUF5802 family protein [Haloferax sp. S2CR25-2]
MFERFSSSYFLGRLYVEPYDGTEAAIHRTEHERLNECVYTDGRGVERVDYPLVMKLDTSHFPVVGDDGVPSGTLALPRDAVGADALPDDRPVLLADAPRAAELLRYAGYDLDDLAPDAPGGTDGSGPDRPDDRLA